MINQINQLNQQDKLSQPTQLYICPSSDNCPSNGKGCEGSHGVPHPFIEGQCNAGNYRKTGTCPGDCIKYKPELSLLNCPFCGWLPATYFDYVCCTNYNCGARDFRMSKENWNKRVNVVKLTDSPDELKEVKEIKEETKEIKRCNTCGRQGLIDADIIDCHACANMETLLYWIPLIPKDFSINNFNDLLDSLTNHLDSSILLSVQYNNADKTETKNLMNWIKRQFNLSNPNTPIVKWFKSIGITQLNAMTYFITTSLHCKLDNQKIDEEFINDLANCYKKYWDVFEWDVFESK
jgi:hypothetical protein